MKEIKELADEMKEELCSAKEYAKCYQTYKNTNPSLAKKFYEMANDELKHAMYLHDMAIDKIEEIKEQNLTLPEYMEMVWKEKHEKYIDKMSKVKSILAM